MALNSILICICVSATTKTTNTILVQYIHTVTDSTTTV